MVINKVLIIDDEKLIRLTTSILLKQRGYDVIEAIDGNAGIESAISEQPDLIMLDIMMPYIDGWQVFDKMQELDETNKIPVIIFTAGDFVASEQIAKSKGIKWIIRKPFNIEVLEKIFSDIENGG